MSHKNQTILVWDSVESPPSGYKGVVLWQSFMCESYPDAISMPKLIEDNAVELKKQYLKFVYDIGVKKLNSQSVIDHMQLRKGFNYWWLTLIAEKCSYSKSIWINDAIRLLAFEKNIKKDYIQNVNLVTSNKLLAKSFHLLSLNNQLEFEWQLIPAVNNSKSIIRRIYRLLPKLLQGVAWLISHIINKWELRGVGLKEWKNSIGKITFCSYLDNLVSESVKKGRYESYYWGHLPDSLLQEDIALNWLHLYEKDSLLPSSKKAADLIRKFNQIGQEKQLHVTIDTFLDWKVIWRSLLDWRMLFKVGSKIRNLNSLVNDDNGYLWPFIKMDLNESLYGRTAISNLLKFNLMGEAFSLLPIQKKGIYLQENQGWEFGLIQAWRIKAHGDLIGFPHSTIRYWDLRYFFDYRSYYNKILNQVPRPNKVALNGKLMRNNYIEGVYPQDELIDVEALRYLYLNKNNNQNNNYVNHHHLVVLVLGDYFSENTDYQMQILERGYSNLSMSIKLIVKPHPNCPIVPSDYAGLKMDVTMDSISSLLTKCNIAYSSNATSAAIDAYCFNLPVISALNPQTLNMSPLMGVKNVQFVKNSDELAKSIEKVMMTKGDNVKPDNVFWLDSNLCMWKKLLMA
jgi:surface carbohydrate biosynthesis protein (TIGR04326 family)